MQEDKNKNTPRDDDHRHEYIPGVQEKSTIGGAYNTGVTSDDPQEKEEIEKKGSLAVLKPKNDSEENSEGRAQNGE
jgi:hypothetical protein